MRINNLIILLNRIVVQTAVWADNLEDEFIQAAIDGNLTEVKVDRRRCRC